jgi:hypothetical protein
MKAMRLMLFVFLAALAVSACSFGNVGVQSNPAGGIDISITLAESEVNTLLSEAIDAAAESGRAVRIQNPTIDLQAGRIVISGDYEQPSGSGNFVSGSITLSVTTSDGRVTVTVTEANVNGFQANDERLTQITERINEALNSRASRDNGANISVTSVTITDNDMTMVINVRQGQ